VTERRFPPPWSVEELDRAAVAAIKEKGVLTGKRIEHSEVGPPGAFDALSDDELERAVVERFNALGLTPGAGSDRRH
jgi:hypothetical protein